MLIDRNTVVTLYYELSDDAGNILSAPEHALTYLHGGYGALFEAVEQALLGKSAGYATDITLAPHEAFGEIDRSLLHAEPRSRFPEQVSAGMRFDGRSENDESGIVYTVIAVTEDSVVVDGNHPLAGRQLHFNCRIEAVRAATAKEIEVGRALSDEA